MKNKQMVNLTHEREKDLTAMADPRNVREEFKKLSLESCHDYCKNDRLPFDACLLNITSDLNVSASIRTLHLLGVDKIYIIGKNKLDRRALVGAEFYTNIEKMGGLNLDDLTIDESVFLTMVQRRDDYYPIFVEMGGENLIHIDWKLRLANPNGGIYRPLLIFGNEHRGIGDNILSTREKMPHSLLVSIPMRGVLRSLNVSAAVSMITWSITSNLFADSM